MEIFTIGFTNHVELFGGPNEMLSLNFVPIKYIEVQTSITDVSLDLKCESLKKYFYCWLFIVLTALSDIERI